MTGLKPFDPLTLVLIAALNPIAIAVALYLGRHADQWQKLPVAAFAASLAGFLGLYVATYIGLLPAKGIGGEAGVVVLQFLFGLIWAYVGYKLRPE